MAFYSLMRKRKFEEENGEWSVWAGKWSLDCSHTSWGGPWQLLLPPRGMLTLLLPLLPMLASWEALDYILGYCIYSSTPLFKFPVVPASVSRQSLRITPKVSMRLKTMKYHTGLLNSFHRLWWYRSSMDAQCWVAKYVIMINYKWWWWCWWQWWYCWDAWGWVAKHSSPLPLLWGGTTLLDPLLVVMSIIIIIIKITFFAI